MNYQSFLKKKSSRVVKTGFNAAYLNDKLFPFQRFTVNEALEKGRFGIFADCGLGKTFMELEFAHQVSNYTQQPVLLVCPLAVGGQTIKEAGKFGYNSIARFGNDTAIEVINYEQLENINPKNYSGIVLDESSILKNHEGTYKKFITESFHKTPYKLACTATPAPNDPMELGNHSEFLNRMHRNEMLAMYFIHDGGETSQWRLKGHAKQRFYQYCREWSSMFTRPSDIGYNDDGYVLPNLNYIEHQIKTANRGFGKLYNDVAVSSTSFHKELRLTVKERMKLVADLVGNSKENFVIWVATDEEGELLRKLIPEAVEVKGSQKPEYKEEMLLGFADNQFRVLITKTKIASFGLNYQNCHNTVFASLDFSFEKLYQAIRRFLRFGQLHDVNAHLITTDTMINVIQSLEKKQRQFIEMQTGWSQAIAA